MPIVIVHGIGVREDGWKRTQQRCEPILRKYLLQPLGLQYLETRWVYWGRWGASFAWNLASLPGLVLESLGVETSEEDSEVLPENLLLHAAQRDLPAFVNQLIVQAIQHEQEDVEPETLIALYEAAQQPDLQQAVQNAQSYEELRVILQSALAPQQIRPIETLGRIGVPLPLNALLNAALWTTDYPVRLTRTVFQKWLRPKLTEISALLLGDVMRYLASRGEHETPGEILRTVRTALADVPSEPLIVLTHSMGGNIFYDLITHYYPEVQVDAWVSVAGQVGLLEELKLFKASNPDVRFPQRVSASSHIGYWLNVYDPVDVLGFAAAPIFEGVEDMPYYTGSGWATHALENYFGAPRFFETIAPKLEAALR